jgi:tetratricopeptide (TPR) repeat protein
MNQVLVDQRRSALIVVSDTYDDKKLTKLQAPKIDAKRLSRLLKKQKIGGSYNVKILSNKKSHTIRVEVERFFRNAEKNDHRLLYFAGHGYKALDDGKYYLVSQDSDLDLTATMIASSFINEQITKSRAINKILILDCCYSGAFLHARADKTVHINQEFELDPGTAILTSSDAMQYSFEGNVAKKEGKTELAGIYTDLLIRGIESEEADKDGDGRIGCSELHTYIKKKMKELGHHQRPQIKIDKEDVTLAYTKEKTRNESPIDYLLNLAHARFMESKYDLSLEAYEKILKVDTHNGNALFGKARCLSYLRRYDESIKYLDKGLDVTNKNLRILFEKALTLRRVGRHHDALFIFEDLAFDSKLPPLIPSFFNRFYDTGIDRVQAAKIHYKELQAILFHPKRALSYWQKRLDSEHIDLAMSRSHNDRQFSKSKESSMQTGIETVNNVAYLLHKLDRNSEALRYLEAALSWYPDDVYALNTAKSILQAAKQQLDTIQSKSDGKAIQEKEDMKYLTREIKRMMKKM